jgi:hypothetical protein
MVGEKMHGMNNKKCTHPRFEVHRTVLLHFRIFCHVTPRHQVSNSQHLQVPLDVYFSPVNKEKQLNGVKQSQAQLNKSMYYLEHIR